MESNDDQDLDTEQRIRRSAGRTLLNWVIALISLGLIGTWLSTGIYYIKPGEAAVVLLLGKYADTVKQPGTRWHPPPPLSYVKTINITEIRRLEFGRIGDELQTGEEEDDQISKNAVQTSDSNIVVPSYVLQYTIKDPFTFLYSMREPAQALHDATQAAVREVIGRQSIDDILSANRAGIERDARKVLMETLVTYAGGDAEKAAFEIRDIQLQHVQAPPSVQEAFDDVIAARQDEDRMVSLADGDAQEILEQANAEAVEFRESSLAYRSSKVLEAQGKAARFESLLAEYQSAREVTRVRLYIETMEEVLPGVDKILLEKEAVPLLPLLSLPHRPPEGS